MANVSKYSVVILAAGTSSRFGQNKAFLKWNSEMSFLEKVTSTYYESGINEGYIVVNNDTFKELKYSDLSKLNQFKIVINSFPEKGRLYSLQLAIQNITEHSYCFIQNIDNPFVSKTLISEMQNNIGNNNYLVPNFEGKNGHPALVSPEVIKKISESDYYTGIKEVLNTFEKKVVQTYDKTILYNINTVEDYKAIFKFVK